MGTHTVSRSWKLGGAVLVALVLLSAAGPSLTVDPANRIDEGVVGVSTGTQQQADVRASGVRPTVRLTVARTSASSNLVRFTMGFKMPEGVDRLQIQLRGATQVVATRGVETTGAHRYVWERSTGSSAAVLTAQANVSHERTHAVGGQRYAGTDRWAFAPMPHLAVRWTRADGDWSRWTRPLATSNRVMARVELGERGVWTGHYVYLGPYAQYNRTVRGERIRVVVAEGAQLNAPPEGVLMAVAALAETIKFGREEGPVTLFALPDPMRPGGEASAPYDAAWVHAESRLNVVDSPWLHEYVHTRQSFTTTPRMAWIREASATYYAVRYAHESGAVSTDDVEQYLSAAPGTVLADPTTWRTDRAQYRSGAAVLLKLDRQIQRATDGCRSLDDVFARMNDRPGPVSFAAFADIVHAVVGRPMDGWLRAHILEPVESRKSRSAIGRNSSRPESAAVCR